MVSMVVAMVALGVTANPDYPEKTDEMVATDETEPTALVVTREIKVIKVYKDFPVSKASVAPRETRAMLAHEVRAGRKVCKVLAVRRAEMASMVNRVPGGCQA